MHQQYISKYGCIFALNVDSSFPNLCPTSQLVCQNNNRELKVWQSTKYCTAVSAIVYDRVRKL